MKDDGNFKALSLISKTPSASERECAIRRERSSERKGAKHKRAGDAAASNAQRNVKRGKNSGQEIQLLQLL